jgi:transcriptional regulator GlxA family with amidase domain
MNASQSSVKSDTPCTQYVFLLLNDFTLMSFAGALETLRLANQLSGKPHFRWVLASENGTDARCSAGITIPVDAGLNELHRDCTIVVCGGINVEKSTTTPILNWLRREARRGVGVVGLCTATYTLAKAGLLTNKNATIHWENHDGFGEVFEDVSLSKAVYIVDGNRATAAGGVAAIDLFLRFVSENATQDLAVDVADELIYSAVRTEHDSQRLSIPSRIGVRHPKLSAVIKTMEDNIEDPISPAILAQDVSLSTRQLERLFRRYLNRSPKRYYMELRLQKARNLLLQTEMSVINVALACGFSSPSHFSKCYRSHYDITPYRERGAHTAP